MQRFNRWLADKITKAVATMWCAYIFALIALVSLPAALATHNVVVIVGWVAQTFLQLVLLSIILVGQSLHTEKQDEIISQNKAIHEHLGIKHHWRRKGDV